VWHWLKISSATGFLRFGKKPNKRVQDGYKLYWLCDECEKRLSYWEAEFAKNVFHPVTTGVISDIVYGPWLLKFCVSISWRVLNYYLEESNISHFSDKLQSSANQAYKIWQDFLLDKRPHPGRHEQHFLPSDIIKQHNIEGLPQNINRYILRTAGFDAVSGENVAYIYSKLERFVIVGFIEMTNPGQWIGTKVHVKRGTIGPRKYSLPDKFLDYFLSKARRLSDIEENISDKQKKKIEESYDKHIDRAEKSESFKAMMHDLHLHKEDDDT